MQNRGRGSNGIDDILGPCLTAAIGYSLGGPAGAARPLLKQLMDKRN